MDMKLLIDPRTNLITICGENNTGKTNTLRAINLFFHPKTFDPLGDAPHHKYEASRGGAVYPEITIEFLKDDTDIYRITKIFDINGLKLTRGEKYKDKRIKNDITEYQIEKIIDKEVAVFFIESINIHFPDLINNIIDDLYDIEFEKARFRGLKKDLKESFENYINGVLEILNNLAKEINPFFQKYHKDWGIGFDSDIDVQNFRDMITNDINSYINDKSNKRIEGKGSGLQRLAYLLINFRIIQKITTKSVYLLIDEPDIFLHHGIQKKLHNDLIELSNKNQIFMTTHSPIFIDSYKLINVFLLELQVSQQYYRRRDREYNILKTNIVELNEINGAKKIRQYLGITERDHEVLDNYNILVEGETDKKYFEELMRFFNIEIPNIIATEGADNIIPYVEWYNSLYREREIKPKILVLCDNDNKGREIYKKLQSKSDKKYYDHLNLKLRFVPNFLGESPPLLSLDGITTNHEIEDFLFPEVICELLNRILQKRKFTALNVGKICSNILAPAFKNNGILSLTENEKNDKNPENGNEIKIDSIQVKKGIAIMFQIEADTVMIKILNESTVMYPAVQKFLQEISTPN